MILDEIKSANVQALKDKDNIARSIYSVILNKAKLFEISKRETGQKFEDDDIIPILQKTIKELQEEKANYEKVGNEQEASNIERQIQICQKYLPKMLSEQEIYDIIAKMEDKSIPNVMKTFKSQYDKKCDMALVRQVLGKFNQ